MRILLVEDDTQSANQLVTTLTNQHYVVDVALEGQSAWKFAESFLYDLVLLNLLVPKLDSIGLCRQLRNQKSRSPILLMTTQDVSSHQIARLKANADDYIVKPFDLEELLAKIQVLLKRSSIISIPIMEWNFLCLNRSQRSVTYSKQELNLTGKEYAILEVLLRSPQRIYSSSVLLDLLWSFDEPPTETAVRTHIKSLRNKLKNAGADADFIETIYGLGYRLKPKKQIAENKVTQAETSSHSKEYSTLDLESSPQYSTLNQPKSVERTKLSISPEMVTIWERYKEKYIDRVAVIEQAVNALRAGNLTAELRNQAKQQAHTLAGSLGSFGLSQASQFSYEIEQILQASPESDRAELSHLSALIVALSQEIQAPLVNSKLPITLHPKFQLLIVDDDRALASALIQEATAWGMHAEVAANLPEARDAIAHHRPDAVILDLCFPDSTENGLALLAELTSERPPVPTLVFTAQESFEDCLKVARLGGRGFLQKPMLPSQIIEAVAQLLQHSNAPAAKLTIVDDDPQLLDFFRTLLEPWGFKLTLLNDPLEFWNTLEQSAPDLLILDLEMPKLSGIDLCQVLRNDPRWNDLPVLFLSARTDAQTIQQVFAAGADDYATKPIVGPELIARILTRLERTQTRRKLIELDLLTGLKNRRKSALDLTHLLRKAERESQLLCFALLDIDHFKQINDRYGHEAGDRVLSLFGEFLKQNFEEEVTGRWGGEEFVVGFYCQERSQVAKRLIEFLEMLHQQKFTDTEERIFQITFSAGVAQFPKDGSDLQSLYRVADGVLYQAKAAGRNRVFVSQ